MVLDSSFGSSLSIFSSFFAQLEDLKLKYYIEGLGGQRGYTPLEKSMRRRFLTDGLERVLACGAKRFRRASLLFSISCQCLAYRNSEFRPIFQQIYETLDQAGRILLQALTFPLDVPWHYFDDMVEDGQSILQVCIIPYPKRC